MMLAVAATVTAASKSDTGSVPLKVYWLTAGGVAVLGLLGTIFSAWIASRVATKTNENHATQIERQLQRDRERAEDEKAHERDQWVRDRRVEVYTRCMTTVDDLIIRGSTDEATTNGASDLRNVISEVGLWAGTEVNQALGMLSGSIFRILGKVPSGEGNTFNLSNALADANERAREFRDAVRHELGLPPFVDRAKPQP